MGKVLPSTESTDRATGSLAVLGVDQCVETHRSLTDPDYLGMLLTTSAIHGHRMEMPLKIVKPSTQKISVAGKPPQREGIPAGVGEAASADSRCIGWADQEAARGYLAFCFNRFDAAFASRLLDLASVDAVPVIQIDAFRANDGRHVAHLINQTGR